MRACDDVDAPPLHVHQDAGGLHLLHADLHGEGSLSSSNVCCLLTSKDGAALFVFIEFTMHWEGNIKPASKIYIYCYISVQSVTEQNMDGPQGQNKWFRYYCNSVTMCNV